MDPWVFFPFAAFPFPSPQIPSPGFSPFGAQFSTWIKNLHLKAFLPGLGFPKGLEKVNEMELPPQNVKNPSGRGKIPFIFFISVIVSISFPSLPWPGTP